MGRFELSLWDRTKSKAEALKLGRVADSPADAIRQAEVVISMMAGAQSLRQVSLGPDGVFAVARKTIVDLSTAGPGMADELARAAELNGARLIAAPVIGSYSP